MKPESRAAVEALAHAIREDAADIVEALVEHCSAEELQAFGNAMIGEMAKRMGDLAEETGFVRGISEVAEKAGRITQGYMELGELDLARAFQKFGANLTTMAKKKLDNIKARGDAERTAWDAKVKARAN